MPLIILGAPIPSESEDNIPPWTTTVPGSSSHLRASPSPEPPGPTKRPRIEEPDEAEGVVSFDSDPVDEEVDQSQDQEQPESDRDSDDQTDIVSPYFALSRPRTRRSIAQKTLLSSQSSELSNYAEHNTAEHTDDVCHDSDSGDNDDGDDKQSSVEDEDTFMGDLELDGIADDDGDGDDDGCLDLDDLPMDDCDELVELQHEAEIAYEDENILEVENILEDLVLDDTTYPPQASDDNLDSAEDLENIARLPNLGNAQLPQGLHISCTDGCLYGVMCTSNGLWNQSR